MLCETLANPSLIYLLLYNILEDNPFVITLSSLTKAGEPRCTTAVLRSRASESRLSWIRPGLEATPRFHLNNQLGRHSSWPFPLYGTTSLYYIYILQVGIIRS